MIPGKPPRQWYEIPAAARVDEMRMLAVAKCRSGGPSFLPVDRRTNLIKTCSDER